MAKFIGIDIRNNILTIELDFPSDDRDEVLKFAKQRLGEDIKLEELKGFIPEFKDMED